jgi:thioredoxin-like negative regulator of GroEL
MQRRSDEGEWAALQRSVAQTPSQIAFSLRLAKRPQVERDAMTALATLAERN